MSSFKFGAILLHSIGLGILTYGWNTLNSLQMQNLIKGQKGGHFQFLTIQGLMVAWLTLALSLISDIFPQLGAVKKMKRVSFMIAMPLAATISTIYWSLLLFFPTLILQGPKHDEFEPRSTVPELPNIIRLPLDQDLSLHAAPGTALLLDFFLFERKYARKVAVNGGALVALAAGTWYACWVEYCASYNGIFPYPFLTFNPLPIRVAIYTGATLFAYIVFLWLNSMHR